MLARTVAVLTGLALLCSAWWMADRNNAEPDGEVSLDIVATAPGWAADTVRTAYLGGDDRDRRVPSTNQADSMVVIDGETSCAGLPAIGQSLEPAPHWVRTDSPDTTGACLLSGRWRLADLVGQHDDDLRVSQSGGHLRVEYTPSTDAWEPHTVLQFDLRARFPNHPEPVEGAPSLTGTTVHWSGTQALRSGSRLSATSRLLPMPQETAPWLVGALALLTVGVGILWPRSPLSPTAADASAPADTVATPSGPGKGTALPTALVRSEDPDPDSPWRPPN
ncbi:MAG: hypothetical protein AAGC63_05910 [Propionicimonas sp.]|nr:hypothetical protein [Propionicimonas sp.]